MATPHYFEAFPNLQYAVSANQAGIPNYISIKDYFHLLKPRDDIFKEETLYESYSVINGERPDQISYNFYGTEQFYWIILQINEIVDYYNQWPLSQIELEKFILSKYGSYEQGGKIHHYETTEVKDDNGNVMLPAGLIVTEDYSFTYKPDPTGAGAVDDIYKTVYPAYGITNRVFEEETNAMKGKIYVLQQKYVYDYQREVQNYARNLDPQKSFVDLGSVGS